MTDSTPMFTPEQLADMGINAEDFSFWSTDAAEFAPTARTTAFEVGKKVTFSAYTQAPTYGDAREQHESGRYRWVQTDPGKQKTGYATMQNARLHRITLIRQVSRYTGVEYLLVTGVMRVSMELGVILDNREVPIDEILWGFSNAMIADESKRQSLDAWNTQAKGIGLDLNGTMPMLWQHMGANEEAVEALFAKFAEAGAIDGMPSIANPGRIERVLYIPNNQPGVPVAAFDISSQDRSFSQTKQGFLDFSVAQIENFARINKFRRAAATELRSLHADIAANKRGLTEQKIIARKAHSDMLRERSREFVANWSGVQQRMVFDDTDPVKPKLTPADPLKFDPENAGIGRFSWAPETDDRVEEVDLWNNSVRQGTPTASTPAASAADIARNVQQQVAAELASDEGDSWVS